VHEVQAVAEEVAEIDQPSLSNVSVYPGEGKIEKKNKRGKFADRNEMDRNKI